MRGRFRLAEEIEANPNSPAEEDSEWCPLPYRACQLQSISTVQQARDVVAHPQKGIRLATTQHHPDITDDLKQFKASRVIDK